MPASHSDLVSASPQCGWRASAYAVSDVAVPIFPLPLRPTVFAGGFPGGEGSREEAHACTTRADDHCAPCDAEADEDVVHSDAHRHAEARAQQRHRNQRPAGPRAARHGT